MLKPFSQLIGLPIFLMAEQMKFGRVLDMALDPETGALIAIYTTKGKVVAPIDLGPFERTYWRVKDQESFIDPKELVRLNNIPPEKRFLIGKQVVTKSGEKLGRVGDFVMDMKTLTLVQLYVKKKFLLFFTREKRIIPRKEIIEVTEKEIIVKDRQATEPEKVEEFIRLQKGMGAPVPMPHARR